MAETENPRLGLGEVLDTARAQGVLEPDRGKSDPLPEKSPPVADPQGDGGSDPSSPVGTDPGSERHRPWWRWLLALLLLLALLGLGLWTLLGGGDHRSTVVNPLVGDPAGGTPPPKGEPTPAGTELPVATPEAWRAFYAATGLKVGDRAGIVYLTGEGKLYISLSTVTEDGAPPVDATPGGYYSEEIWKTPEGKWKPFPSGQEVRKFLGLPGSVDPRWIKDASGAIAGTPWPDGAGTVYGIAK